MRVYFLLLRLSHLIRFRFLTSFLKEYQGKLWFRLGSARCTGFKELLDEGDLSFMKRVAQSTLETASGLVLAGRT